TGITEPRRFDVVVFKYPETPVINGAARNYIKRLLGLPGEILAILFGQLFYLPAPADPTRPYFDDLAGLTEAQKQVVSKRLWIKQWHWSGEGGSGPNWIVSPQEREMLGNFDYENADFTHANAEASLRLFHEGKFKPIRKTPEVMLAMRRIVFDNDFQPKDLQGK